LNETSKYIPKFIATGGSLLIKFNSQREEQDIVTYLKECISALKNYLVNEEPGRDLKDLRIRNSENIGIKWFPLVYVNGTRLNVM